MTELSSKAPNRQHNRDSRAIIALSPRTVALCLALCLSLCLALCLFTECEFLNAKFPEQATIREHLLERFNLSRDSHFVLLPVEIQGRKTPFILDTGATLTTYDASLRSFLSGPVQRQANVYTPNGEISAAIYSSPPAQLGHLNLPSKAPVLCLDLRLRGCFGDTICGFLGMDFLGGHVFRIDFDSGEVTFLRSTDSDSSVRIPITFRDGLPQVQARIPGLPKSEVFTIDTGSAAKDEGSLRAEVFDSLSRQGILKPAGHRLSVTVSGSGHVRQGRLQEFSLGCFRHRQLLFARSSKYSHLGINYLSRYVATFDCPNGAIYLKEGRHFYRTDRAEE